MTRRDEIVVGSRGNRLALRQTEFVVARLQSLDRNVRCRVRIFETEGDLTMEVPLTMEGSRRDLVPEIESALLAGDIDLAVHRLEELPYRTTPGLTLAGIPEREDARDVLVSRRGCRLLDLPPGVVVGMSSAGRAAQVLALRPDLRPASLCGDVDTCLAKAQTVAYDGIVIAAASLHRLNWRQHITEYLPFEVCLPAPGQGALAVETRAGDEELIELVRALDHEPTRQAVTAERSLVEAWGGGQMPLGAFSSVEDGVLALTAVVGTAEGRRLCRGSVCGNASEAVKLGQALGERLTEWVRVT